MEIYQDTRTFYNSCARVRCFIFALGNDSWALGDGECILLPGGDPLLPLYLWQNRENDSNGETNWDPGL